MYWYDNEILTEDTFDRRYFRLQTSQLRNKSYLMSEVWLAPLAKTRLNIERPVLPALY